MCYFALLVLLLSLLGTAAAADYSLVVKKSERKMYLYTDGKLTKTYKIALGFSPVGTKERQGDGRTPEGDYRIVQKNPKSQFYLSLGLDYPSVADAKRGLDAKLITRAQYNAIVAAHKRQAMPPQGTALGGEIYIHGTSTESDWTWGCIALEKDAIKELYDLLPIGTPVRIDP